MTPPIIPRDQVAQNLSVPTATADPLRGARAGPRRSAQGAVEGYGPAEVRRIWTIVSCQRDLGINLAGVEAILKLRDHLAEVHRQLDALARELREALEDETRARPRCLNRPRPSATPPGALERPEARRVSRAGR